MSSAERRQRLAPPMSNGPASRHETWNETRRRIYLGIVALGLLVQVTNWSLNLLRASPDLVTLFSNPVFFVMSSWNLYWLYTRRPMETIYLVALVVCGLVILARAVATPLLGGPSMLTSLEDLYWLLAVISIVSFLMLDYRRAMLMTATFYAVSALVPWAMLALSGVPFAQAARLGQVQLLCAIVLATLCSLSWYREHFVLERQAFELTQQVANTDALTGLSNRHALYPQLEAAVRQTEQGTPVALVLIDIDHFKSVNDRLGHLMGDEVLCGVAHTLRRSLRDNDLIGRWGGEEFLVALCGVTPEDAGQIAERLRRAVAEYSAPAGLAVTISLGVAPLLPGENLQAGVSRADRALYAAKAGGRNRVERAVLAVTELGEAEAAEDGNELSSPPQLATALP